MQYLTQHPSKGTQQKRVCTNASHVCRWSIAAGKRPVPFRTRKLSLHTLMVLQPGGCGRVSHRRHQTTITTKYRNNEAVEDNAHYRVQQSPTASFSFSLPTLAPSLSQYVLVAPNALIGFTRCGLSGSWQEGSNR